MLHEQAAVMPALPLRVFAPNVAGLEAVPVVAPAAPPAAPVAAPAHGGAVVAQPAPDPVEVLLAQQDNKATLTVEDFAAYTTGQKRPSSSTSDWDKKMKAAVVFDYGSSCAEAFRSATVHFTTVQCAMSRLATATANEASDLIRLLNGVADGLIGRLGTLHTGTDSLTADRIRKGVLIGLKEAQTGRGDHHMPPIIHIFPFEIEELIQLCLLLEVGLHVEAWKLDDRQILVRKIQTPEFILGVMNAELNHYRQVVAETKGWGGKFFTRNYPLRPPSDWPDCVPWSRELMHPGASPDYEPRSSRPIVRESRLPAPPPLQQFTHPMAWNSWNANMHAAPGPPPLQPHPPPHVAAPPPRHGHQAHVHGGDHGTNIGSTRPRGTDKNGTVVDGAFFMCGACSGIGPQDTGCPQGVCKRAAVGKDFANNGFADLPMHPRTYDPNARLADGRPCIEFFTALSGNKFSGQVAVIMDPARIKPAAVDRYLAALRRQVSGADVEKVRQALHGGQPLLALPAPPLQFVRHAGAGQHR